MQQAGQSILYFAAGDLAYGGRAHYLLAGTVFAGTVVQEDTGLADCQGLRLPVPARGGRLRGELYYADPWILENIEKRLGLERARGRARHGELLVETTYHRGRDCKPMGPVRSEERILIAIPPLLPPPATPLAVYPALLRDYKPCQDSTAYCKTPGITHQAGVADIVAHPARIKEWLEANSLELEPATATTTIAGREYMLYTHVPVPRAPGAQYPLRRARVCLP